ncbi:MAG: FAD-binding domain-containing protein [Gemmobacter sp.]|nr:FAD-binding domain-containing protein [Gemmobacter sp.]
MAELETTGYLHNWARMQFASIWVFTLGLPWELGAAFTLPRFVDGDPASNTLSWRWVAGLHTAGKAYLSDADRIARMTGGRFAPQGLARQAILPADSIAVPQATPPRAARTPTPLPPACCCWGVRICRWKPCPRCNRCAFAPSPPCPAPLRPIRSRWRTGWPAPACTGRRPCRLAR